MVGGFELRYLAGLPLAALFCAAGYGHFAHSRFFVGIMKGMPLPGLHMTANYVTGALEILGGMSMILRPTAEVYRGMFWLVVLMSAANVNMYINDVPAGGKRMTYGFPFGTHYIRAYAQVFLLGWLHFLAKAFSAADPRSS